MSGGTGRCWRRVHTRQRRRQVGAVAALGWGAPLAGQVGKLWVLWAGVCLLGRCEKAQTLKGGWRCVALGMFSGRGVLALLLKCSACFAARRAAPQAQQGHPSVVHPLCPRIFSSYTPPKPIPCNPPTPTPLLLHRRPSVPEAQQNHAPGRAPRAHPAPRRGAAAAARAARAHKTRAQEIAHAAAAGA